MYTCAPQSFEDMLYRLKDKFGGRVIVETELRWPSWNLGDIEVVGHQHNLTVKIEAGWRGSEPFTYDKMAEAELYVRALMAEEVSDAP